MGLSTRMSMHFFHELANSSPKWKLSAQLRIDIPNYVPFNGPDEFAQLYSESPESKLRK